MMSGAIKAYSFGILALGFQHMVKLCKLFCAKYLTYKSKKHPCLVPYGELPEEEKIYDRNTSIETLKFIVMKGFEIKKI